MDDRCTVPFLRICEFLEQLQTLKRGAKAQSLQDFYQHSKVTNFFPIVRLILPSYDMERGNYGLKESTLAKYYADLLSLPSQYREALIYFKNPKKQLPGSVAGGFVEILETILQDRVGDSAHFTVEQVNTILDNLSLALDKDKKKKALSDIVRNMNVLEQKWVARIILKDMKIGANDTILKAFHPLALDIYSYTNNLREVFTKLKDPNIQLGIQLYNWGQPIKPMLAGRKQYHDLKNLLSQEDIYLETKFDGERIHCHWSVAEIKYFSRNAMDVTNIYADALNDVLNRSIEGIQSCILDGELIVWDFDTNGPAPFGSNKTVAIDRSTNKSLCYMVFDILYMETAEGKSDLMKIPLSERKEKLRLILRDVPHRLEKVRFKTLRGFKGVFEEFNKALERNEEGLIIKQKDSPYIPDDRSILWLKMKNEYFEGMSDTLDLLVLGGYYGKSHRIGTETEFDHITVFLVGVSSRIDLKDPKKSKFVPLCKVGTGYTFVELGELRTKLKPHWQPFKTSPDYWPHWVPKSGERPDYIIPDPSLSVILEVKGAELVASDKFPIGRTVRFPRVHKIRYDKSWDMATSYTELKDVIDSTERDFRGSREEPVPTRRKRDTRRLEKGLVVNAFRDTNTEGIIPSSEIFKNCVFYVANASGFDKSQLETLIVQNGGQKVQNFVKGCTHVLASDSASMKVANLIEKYDLDVINPQWLLDSVHASQVIELKPRYMIHQSRQLAMAFLNRFNRFGDDLTARYNNHKELIDIVMRVEILQTVKWEDFPQEVKNILRNIPRFKLMGEVIFVENTGTPCVVNGRDLMKELVTFRLEAHGGIVIDYFCEEVNLVVTIGEGISAYDRQVVHISELTDFLS